MLVTICIYGVARDTKANVLSHAKMVLYHSDVKQRFRSACADAYLTESSLFAHTHNLEVGPYFVCANGEY